METLLIVCTGMYSAVWHNRQTAMLLEELEFGHVRQYAPFSLLLSALHSTHFEHS